MNRCIGLNKYGKKCKTRINDPNKLICCEQHAPYNKDILNFCEICCDTNLSSNDIYTLYCNHSFHKKCLDEYIKLSELNNNYKCIYCRKNNNSNKKIKINKNFKFDNNILNNNNFITINNVLVK